MRITGLRRLSLVSCRGTACGPVQTVIAILVLLGTLKASFAGQFEDLLPLRLPHTEMKAAGFERDSQSFADVKTHAPVLSRAADFGIVSEISHPNRSLDANMSYGVQMVAG